ncbi:MAG: hypothetical protein U0136_17045 [Bdellovibrionota bacterium]
MANSPPPVDGDSAPNGDAGPPNGAPEVTKIAVLTAIQNVCGRRCRVAGPESFEALATELHIQPDQVEAALVMHDALRKGRKRAATASIAPSVGPTPCDGLSGQPPLPESPSDGGAASVSGDGSMAELPPLHLGPDPGAEIQLGDLVVRPLTAAEGEGVRTEVIRIDAEPPPLPEADSPAPPPVDDRLMLHETDVGPSDEESEGSKQEWIGFAIGLVLLVILGALIVFAR